MRCIRQGTHKKIENRLREHKRLMDLYIAEGMARENASKLAFDIVTGRKGSRDPSKRSK